VGEHPVHQNIPELQSALKLADKDLYLNIHTIFKLLIVLTVTSVCCKHSFSALHRDSYSTFCNQSIYQFLYKRFRVHGWDNC
jgi:hypothetical protein